ncbi:MAG TPA: cytochrome c [Chloroflexota bacterium]|jgi:mono/diheme cytochrome c family protein|nr:cytochrome c [Chloroflexota bacterium]
MSRSSPLRWFIAVVLLMTACTQKMALQPSYRPFQPSDQFADGMSARPRVPDTIARGQLGGDGQPTALTMELLDRGQQRFDIYCAPCHGYAGDGDGMIVQRGFTPPPSFHSDRLRAAPLEHFFTIATNGFGAMPSYAAQVPEKDRWAIAAYIRALQLSQHATLDDVPVDERGRLEAGP